MQREVVFIPKTDAMDQMMKTISKLQKKLSQAQKKVQQFSKNDHQECPSGHPLRYAFGPNLNLWKKRQCNICHRLGYKISNVLWSCEVCDYDLCRQCCGYKRNLCPYMHQLAKTQSKYEAGYSICDICLANVKKAWHCDCGFDICLKCHDKERK